MSLPRPITEPFSDVDLSDPVQRLSTIAELIAWAERFGMEVLPDPAPELEELTTIVEQIEAPARRPSPATGLLDDELQRIEAQLSGNRTRPAAPRFHDPRGIMTISALAMKMRCTWWVCDGRPGQAEVQALYRWFRDPTNVSKLADRLGYRVQRAPE